MAESEILRTLHKANAVLHLRRIYDSLLDGDQKTTARLIEETEQHLKEAYSGDTHS